MTLMSDSKTPLEFLPQAGRLVKHPTVAGESFFAGLYRKVLTYNTPAVPPPSTRASGQRVTVFIVGEIKTSTTVALPECSITSKVARQAMPQMQMEMLVNGSDSCVFINVARSVDSVLCLLCSWCY